MDFDLDFGLDHFWILIWIWDLDFDSVLDLHSHWIRILALIDFGFWILFDFLLPLGFAIRLWSGYGHVFGTGLGL